MPHAFPLLLSFLLLSWSACAPAPARQNAGETDRIRSYGENPRYWQYEGRPDLLVGGSREAETVDNLLETYLGYRQALLQLQQLTYYDFEQDMPLLERFRIRSARRR